MVEKLTDARILKEFKNVIIPGICRDTFANVDIMKSSGIFIKYIAGLEQEGIIDDAQASSLEKKFIKIIRKRV